MLTGRDAVRIIASSGSPVRISKMQYFKLLIPVIVLSLSGCATAVKMPVSSDQEIDRPEPGQAQIVFMRSTFFGSAISASLYDITTGYPKFLGIIQNENKIVYPVPAGEHMFMVIGESADFMGANVDVGKTYYAMVTPRMGAWKARFSLKPIRGSGTGDYVVGSSDFKKWVDNTKIVEVDKAARDWYAENLSNVKSKQDEYWPKWVAKSEEDKRERTLQPDDGV